MNATATTTEAQDYFARKVAFTTGPVEVNEQIKAGEKPVVIDVRDADDFEKGHVPGALNLPEEHWNNSPEVLSKDGVNILYCYSPTCHLAARAAVQFAGQGFEVMEMDGGFEAWEANDLEVEK